MRLSFGLEQKQVQKQILAPRMIQSMEILQLPVLALEKRIEQEIIENPALEAQESEAHAAEAGPAIEEPKVEVKSEQEKELVVDESNNNAEDFERLLEMDREFPGAFGDGPTRSAGALAEASERKMDAIANIAAPEQSLQTYLEIQIGEADIPEDVRKMATRIVSSLDSNGYLTASLQDLLPADADEETVLLAHKALAFIQSLEPAGVGARDLRECLLLQLKPDLPMYEEVKTLVSGYLKDLGENRLPTIQRKTGYSIERIQEATEHLRTLNPKPGSSFRQVSAPTVTPDVFLDRQDDGSYKVRLEDGRTPTLRISNYYRNRLASGQATPEEREFIKRKVNAAQWLIESIEQRRNTLTRVAQAIVDYQSRFIDEGPQALETLKMQQIADQVGVHVTTVSRAVDEKYIQTPRGIFALKRFFVGGTKKDDGEDVAWENIRVKLQEVIDGEDKSKPFSDDELVKRLKAHGLSVARRTITKYRKKMGIPSSRQRRDWTQKDGDNAGPSPAPVGDDGGSGGNSDSAAVIG